MHIYRLSFLILLLFVGQLGWAQHSDENSYYRMTTIPAPEGVHLEAGGVTVLPDGSVAMAVRRGEVWIIENPTLSGGQPGYKLFASGLHEPLGLTYKDGALYTAQRGELTKLVDTDGDRIADVYETIYSWPVSGHYHEYSYGPKFTPEGDMFVSGNVAFGDEEWWRGESRVPWRGWIMKISPNGKMQPWATGMRSPAGLGMINGELFYADNQGDWIGSGGIWHIQKGSFTGHAAGLRWTGEENSPLSLTTEEFYARVDPRKFKKNGRYVKPENIVDEKDPAVMFEVKKDIPELTLPAVWLPHGVLGISNSEIISDETTGKFGPFAGQMLIGDQGQSKIMRVYMEKVNGEYQGVAFDFRKGFQSGVMRMAFDSNGNLFVGETNRGWGSAGTTNSGLQYLTWTGKMPFEMKTVSAKTDGFEIEFTQPVDRKLAEDLDSYSGRNYTYKYHPVYGSPPIRESEMKIQGVKVSDDGMKVRVVVTNLQQYHLHELHVRGIKSAEGKPVLHPSAYYTLNNIPETDTLAWNTLSTKRTSASVKPVKKGTPKRNTSSAAKAPTYEEIEPLLVKNTCTACHNANQRVVGPSFKEIARRKYSDSKIIELIYQPQPQNWPEYATPMAPMPQVPKSEALQIAGWINSLR